MALARSVHFRIWHLMVRIRIRRWSEIPDVNRMYWVDPDKIEYALVFSTFDEYDKIRDRGKVIGGDWDQKRVKFTESGLVAYHCLEDRFIRGMRWEETEFYQRVLDVLSIGKALWGWKNKAEFDERCKYLDSLFHDIKTNGFRSQQEIRQEENNPLSVEDEITVRIGRDGALLFEDGQHRLAIAKLLDIDKIPIKITARHSEWYRFRKEIIQYGREYWGGEKIYQPITHPDLSDIPSVYGDERFEIIKAYMPVKGGDLLDIGAHWGYFCHKFEEEGFNCYAVESDAPTWYFLEKLRIAENRKFKIVYGSILDYRDKTDFDVVLALNIFHHFIRTEETYYKMIDLLKRLDMKVMFFQPALPDTPVMKGAYLNFDCDEFVDFILENSNLNEAIYIGETHDKRPIYRLQAT